MLKAICDEIELRYEIEFLEIGADRDHTHFLVQSVPRYSSTKIVRIVERITAREIFARVPNVKKMLTSGYMGSCGADSFGLEGISWRSSICRRHDFLAPTANQLEV